MRSIIETISSNRNASFQEEESTWFNGEMNAPVKTYSLSFPVLNGNLHLEGEYRRNVWQKPNWYKNISQTDIYLWTVSVESQLNLPKSEIKPGSWINRLILNRKGPSINSESGDLKEVLADSKLLKRLFDGDHEVIHTTIRILDQKIWMTFSSLIDHERLVNTAIETIEFINTKANLMVDKS